MATDLDLDQAVEQAIQDTLPNGPSERNGCVFQFARRLRAIPALADARGKELKEYVRQWHRLALPVIRTKEWEETWADFLHGWNRVQFPAGTGPLSLVAERAPW